MSTLRLTIMNGEFVQVNMKDAEWFNSKCIRANGWRCMIKDDGTLICDTKQEYEDGFHTMKYRITRLGYEQLTLKVPGKEEVWLKTGYVTSKGVRFNSGVVGLTDGEIDKRRTYFRTIEYQNFLNEHGITAVKHEDPNRLFSVHEKQRKNSEAVTFIVTNGKKWQTSSETRIRTVTIDAEVETITEFKQNWKVVGSTWVIYYKTKYFHEGDVAQENKAFLYTLEKDVTRLTDLPIVK